MPPRRALAADPDSSSSSSDSGDAVDAARSLRLAKQRRTGTAAGARRTNVGALAAEEGEAGDEVVVRIDKSRTVLRMETPREAAPAEAVVGREVYTADRIAQLKRESVAAERPEAPLGPQSVLIGMDALRLAEAQERQAAEPSDGSKSKSSSSSSESSSSSSSSDDESERPKSPAEELGMKIRRGHDNPQSILDELVRFGETLRERQAELTASLERLAGAEPIELSTKEANAAAAARVRQGIADMALYLRGLRACLGAMEPVISRAEKARVPSVYATLVREDSIIFKAKFRLNLSISPRPGIGDATSAHAGSSDVSTLFDNVHEDFASARAVVARFAQWRQADTLSFDSSGARDSLPQLLAPFVRWSLLTWSGGPLPSTPSQWPGMPAVDDDLALRIAVVAGESATRHLLRVWTTADSPATLESLILLARRASSPSLQDQIVAALRECAKGVVILPIVQGDLESDSPIRSIVDERLSVAISLLSSMAQNKSRLGDAAKEIAAHVWSDAAVQHCLERRPTWSAQVAAVLRDSFGL